MIQSETYKTPSYWDILSPSDQKEYKVLQRDLYSTACRNLRNQRLDSFIDVLEIVKKYTAKNDQNDWKRYLVCGICWLSDCIAINTVQFSILIGKCKSSINGSFQRLGYKPYPCSISQNAELLEKIPHFENHLNEIRQWTLRKQFAITPEPKYDSSINLTKKVISHNNDENVDFFNDPYLCPFDSWVDDSELNNEPFINTHFFTSPENQ